MLTVCLLAVDVSVALGAPAACQQYDSHGICVVQAETGGPAAAPSTQPVSAGSDGDGVVTEPRCTATPSGAEVPCQDGDGWWVQSMQCYVSALAEQPPKGTAVWGSHTDGAIYLCTLRPAGTNFPGTNGFAFWSATVPAVPAVIDPVALARQALQTLTIPAPTPGRYPAGHLQDGQPFTVVAGGELVKRHHDLTLGSTVPPQDHPGWASMSSPAPVILLLRRLRL